MRLMRLLCLCPVPVPARPCAVAGRSAERHRHAARGGAAPSTPAVRNAAPPGESLPAQPPAQLLPGKSARGGTQPTAVAQQAAAVEEIRMGGDARAHLRAVWCRSTSIRTRAFDTEWKSNAQATGFVVDAERGLILPTGTS